jgi:peptide/nickel transport system substrate-binding protein
MWRALLQDRLDGPQWMTLDPILGVSAIKDLAMKIAGVDSFDKVDPASIAKTADAVKAAIVADDAAGTVTIHLVKATPWFLQLLSQPFLGSTLDMEYQVAQGDWDGDSATWPQWNDPAQEDSVLFNDANGTGPYMLDHWTPGVEIVEVANENYWRTEPIWPGGPSGVPTIKRLVWKLVEEWGTRLAMFQAGDIDGGVVPRAYIAQVEPMVREQYDGGDENAPMTVVNPQGSLKLFKGYTTAAMTPAMFNFNINVEGGNPYIGSGALDGNGIPPDFFSDIDVRQAFNYAFDWDTFIRDALQGEGVQAKGPILEGYIGYDPNQAIYTHDLAKAEEHFKAAWGGQVWEKGFYVQLAYNTGNEERRIASEIIELNVETVNPAFDIVVLNLPWPSYLSDRRAAKLPISVSGWLEDYHDPSNWVQPFMDCAAGAYARAQSFPQDLCDQISTLEAQGLASIDPAVRGPIYAQLQNLAYEQAIDIFLYQATGRRYMQRWISGNYYNPLYGGTVYPYAITKAAPTS